MIDAVRKLDNLKVDLMAHPPIQTAAKQNNSNGSKARDPSDSLCMMTTFVGHYRGR